jgi:hypothetical protein
MLVPSIKAPDMGSSGRAVLYIMSAAIGYAASGVPARGISRILKKWVLGETGNQ